MKYSNLFGGFFFLVFLGSSEAIGKRPPTVLIQFAKQTIEISAIEEAQKKIIRSKITVTYSTFVNPKEADVKTVIERRKNSFLGLFKDERNPYTGIITKRADCLSDQSSDQVKFYSGPGVQWADCELNKKKLRGVRSWIHCGGELFEINLQYSGKEQSPKLLCKESD